MTIVGGHLLLKPGTRDQFLAASRPVVEAARQNPHCASFSVSPDLVDDNRVNVFEQWSHRDALMSFRETGPGSEMTSLIVSVAVEEWEVTPSN